jgi:hypothetical protein
VKTDPSVLIKAKAAVVDFMEITPSGTLTLRFIFVFKEIDESDAVMLKLEALNSDVGVPLITPVEELK